jgi:hypothetical protein
MRSSFKSTALALALGGSLLLHAGASQAAPASKATISSFECNTDVSIKSSSLNEGQANEICGRLNTTRNEFMTIFNGGADLTPATGDKTVGVDLYVFKNERAYRQAGKKMNFPTNNGGLMSENDPTVAGNRAFIATYADGKDMTRVTNLEHEFVHYLTFRYLAPGDRDLPLWFVEGVADNIGNPQHLPDQIESTWDAQFELSDILNNTSEEDPTMVYDAGSVAVEYFLTTRQAEIASFADGVEDSDRAVEQWTQRIGSSLDADFQAWLAAW